MEKQIEGGKEFVAALEQLTRLMERAEKETKLHSTGGGLWREGGELNLLDALVAPCTCIWYLIFFKGITDVE